ncbi:MAG: hypothetical protein JJT96_19965 [Opitutales bacterium]|nr:hypothetical protein [Opitutales bacterium]
MKGVRRIVAGFALLFLAGSLAARTAFIEQLDYSVEGISTEKVFEVNEWAREWFRYLRSHGMDVPPGIPPIRIVLLAESGTGEPAGSVGTVLVGGLSGLDRDAVIDGIVASSLIRYARWRGMAVAPAPWMVTGLTEHFLVYWNPARRDALSAAVLSPREPVPLQTLLRATPQSMAERGAAYAVLSAVGWPDGGAGLMERLLANPLGPFSGFLEEPVETSTEGDLWLATTLADFRLSTGTPVWNLDTSAWRLEWLAMTPAEWRGQLHPRRLDLLRDARAEPDRREWLEERLQLTKGAITRIHPVYHNAVLSLGWVWESIIRRDPQHVVSERIRDFEEDLALAHQLRTVVEQTVGDD